MTRSKLLGKFREEETKENKDAYNKQRNHCVDIIRKTKKDLYNNPDVKRVTDNKLFWKTVKPFFSNKGIKDQRIILTLIRLGFLRVVYSGGRVSLTSPPPPFIFQEELI